ncbi:LysR family transcriptional regulator [Plastoroseomonas hellenica]|uniref:LysR family transcriptional regulator n=1 Tax=Plastoroseomonas hellenica TaxID=2687306 RepID=UPI001BAD3474|nr:LysR family transcriptional regulator [Plastoroseomonas hellenica]MBR0645328.1 LysR family transcriptional regulator [Plastoroseomonas hellenica]
MQRVSLGELEIFAAIARARSFRKAATERGVSASALSQALRNLEERLGVRLLNRTTRSVSLTEAGEALLRRLRPALDEVEGAVEAAYAFRRTPAGSLRINAPAPAVEFILGPMIAPFLEAYPDISLEIIADAAFVDIVESGFDAGVRFGEELARDMIAMPLGPPLDYAVVAAPGYLAKRGTPAGPDDLLGHNCIRHRFPGGTIFEWSFEKDGRAVSIVPEGRLTVNDSRQAVRAAKEGVGLARVPVDYVQAELATGELVRVLRDWSPLLPSWFLYYPSRRQMPPAMRAFLDFIGARKDAAVDRG